MKEIKADGGKLLEVRGPSGNSVDRDRHNGFHEVLDKSGKKFEVIEVVGKWDDGTAQKATADAIAIHKKFDGIYTQGGSTGTVQALSTLTIRSSRCRAKPKMAFANYARNMRTKASRGHRVAPGPAQVAVTIKAAIAALQGNPIPQSISLPVSYVEYPNMKEGQDYYPDLSDNFFVGNSFPACNIGFTAD